ncbi:MAG: flagellar basal body-associated FliL family protein [Acidobacteria bacterium]|nr:flagellar basal body-associated FliL family protein [Acidobacteriota bacterium]
MGSLLITVMAASLAAVAITGGGFFYMMRSGKMVAAAQTKPAAPVEEHKPAKTHPVALDPMLVNLADAGGHAYLKIAVTLLVQDPETKEKPKEEAEAKGKEKDAGPAASARDAILTVVTAKTSEQLLASEGKEQLKHAIAANVTKRVPEFKVSEVLFTDFLVQR